MLRRNKPKWSSTKDEQQPESLSITTPALAQKIGFSGRLLRRWDILRDWLSAPSGRIVLAVVALSAAWFLLKV